MGREPFATQPRWSGRHARPAFNQATTIAAFRSGGRRGRRRARSVPAPGSGSRACRAPRREHARGVLHRRLLQPHAVGAARRRKAPARRDAGLPAGRRRCSATWTRRSRILQLCSHGWEELTGLHALRDGDRIEPWGDGDDDRGGLHAVRPSGGPVYLGTLARRTLITTNVWHVSSMRRTREARHLHAGAA